MSPPKRILTGVQVTLSWGRLDPLPSFPCNTDDNTTVRLNWSHISGEPEMFVSDHDSSVRHVKLEPRALQLLQPLLDAIEEAKIEQAEQALQRKEEER